MVIKIIFLLYLLAIPIIAFEQDKTDYFVTNTGDCGGNYETSYLLINRTAPIRFVFDQEPDSIRFNLVGLDSFKIEQYHCYIEPTKVGDFTISCAIYRAGKVSKITKTYTVIEQPDIHFKFILSLHNPNEPRLYLRLFEGQTNKDVSADYQICLYEYTLSKPGSKQPYFDFFGHTSIDLKALEKLIKHKIKTGDILNLTYVRLISKKYEQDLYYHTNVAYVIEAYQ